MSDILWRGRWASSAGVVIEHRPVRTVSERVARTLSVPGRNGAGLHRATAGADAVLFARFGAGGRFMINAELIAAG